jgi:hypothetical protein
VTEHGLQDETFEKGLSNKGYAKHTPTLRKPKFRLTDARGYEINPWKSVQSVSSVFLFRLNTENHYITKNDMY